MKRSFYLKLLLVGLLVLNLLNALAPLLVGSSHALFQWIGTGIYFLLDPACHQQPERSFFIKGLPMALCVRCTFIYLGMAAGLVMIMVKKRLFLPEAVYVSFLIFLILEIGTEAIGIYSNFKTLRSISGLVSGILLIIFLITIVPERVFKKGKQ
ncbi:DUF2085 domain-containing protein [Calditrichota bacterium LG25]